MRRENEPLAFPFFTIKDRSIHYCMILNRRKEQSNSFSTLKHTLQKALHNKHIVEIKVLTNEGIVILKGTIISISSSSVITFLDETNIIFEFYIYDIVGFILCENES